MTKVLVGIPTFNGFQRVDWLLQSISTMTDKDIDYKIVICDDSGKKEHQEKTRSVIDKWIFNLPIKLICNDKNMGVAKSWNNIIKSEDSQYIILINDDVIVAKGWLENMVYFLDNNPNTGVVYYDFTQIKESDIPQLLSSNYQLPFDNLTPIRCMHYIGCFFGFSRDKYNIVGGFDENYFANFEETDFCTALVSHGYPNYILRYPICLHVYSATFKSAPEINYWAIFEKSERYYNKKWKGSREDVNKFYMSKIPFQKVKWTSNDDIHEEILIDDYGYFNVKINNESDSIKIEI